MVAFVEYDIVAYKIVDELVLPNEKGALCSDGIVDGGGEVILGAVEGAYPATVNAQLQRRQPVVSRCLLPRPPQPALRGGSCSDNCSR